MRTTTKTSSKAPKVLSMTKAAIKARERRAAKKAALQQIADQGGAQTPEQQALVEGAEQPAPTAEIVRDELVLVLEHEAPRTRRPEATLPRAELVKVVREYALDHYESGRGWDYIVETYTDEEILRAMGRSRTARGALWKVGCEVLRIARAAKEREAMFA